MRPESMNAGHRVSWAALVALVLVPLLAVGALIGYLAIPGFSVFGVRIGFGLPWLFTLLAVLPGAIYLADVKPEVIRYLRRPGPSTGRW